MPGTNVAGINNSTNDPMLVNWQGPITAANIRSNFALLPGSPAIGAGPNGLDMGALVPSGASISASGSIGTDMTLRVAGPGVVAFRWKLNNGAWSPEVPLTNSFQITTNYFNPTNGLVRLNDLPNGAYTFYAMGKNSAGFYQPTNSAASYSWTIQPEQLRVDRITKSGDTVKLYFRAIAGQTYTVQRRNSLATGAWAKLTDVSGAGEVEVVDAATAPERFYRIVTPAQP